MIWPVDNNRNTKSRTSHLGTIHPLNHMYIYTGHRKFTISKIVTISYTCILFLQCHDQVLLNTANLEEIFAKKIKYDMHLHSLTTCPEENRLIKVSLDKQDLRLSLKKKLNYTFVLH